MIDGIQTVVAAGIISVGVLLVVNMITQFVAEEFGRWFSGS